MRLLSPTWKISQPSRLLSLAHFGRKTPVHILSYYSARLRSATHFPSQTALKLKALVMLRQVKGVSMLPALRNNSMVWATALYRSVKAGDVVIIRHGGLEKIKRVEAVVDGQLFVLGDNSAASTDSRSFGWLPLERVQAKVIWPRAAK